MSKAGWYPDPGGQAGMFRWWDGVQWTPTLTSNPYAPPPWLDAGGVPPIREAQQAAADPYASYRQSEQRRSGRGPMVLLGLIGLVVVAVVIGAFSLFGGGLNPFGPGQPPASNPTGNVCPVRDDQNESAAPHTDPPGRTQGGQLSYPTLGAPWGPVTTESRVPFGRDVYGQNVLVEPNYDGQGSDWVASVLVGELVAGDGFFSPEQGAEIVTRCVMGVFYGDAELQRVDRVNQATTLDGRDAWLVEMHLGFDIRGLSETGETAIILIVATSAESSSLWYASIPDSRPELLQTARQIQSQLRVEP